MKKRKIIKILLFVLLTIITTIYTYQVRFLVDDEIFNYGFAKNILDGLIPYKDFNMIIPPLFAYITALFLKIFGEKLIVYHIILAIIISTITYINSKKINKSSIVIYILLLIYPYTGYNMFSLLLLFILLNIKEERRKFYLEPIIISLMILTKHTLGLLVIPNLIYSKNKMKTFLIYIVSFLFLVLYLVLNNNMFEFINYTILGIFDFAKKNSSSINLILITEIFIIGLLIYKLIKTRKKEYAYVLAFQIVAFPILNYVHFIISFIPVVYLILDKYKKNFYFSWFFSIILISFFLGFNALVLKERHDYNYVKSDIKNFMENRIVHEPILMYQEIIDEYIEIHKERDVYIFSNLAYQIKLNLNYKINKYDLINNGNMGYKGSEKYIKEIDKNCQKNKCIFFINELELTNNENFQTNKAILVHFTKKYQKIYSSSMFNIYIN